MFQYTRSLFVFVLLVATMSLSAYSLAASSSYECESFRPADYRYPTNGWVPSEFSITVDRTEQEVTKMKSNAYTYDLDEITVKKMTKKVTWLYYKASTKTASGANVNARHSIKIYPKDYKILYDVQLPGGYKAKGKGFCRSN